MQHAIRVRSLLKAAGTRLRIQSSTAEKKTMEVCEGHTLEGSTISSKDGLRPEWLKSRSRRNSLGDLQDPEAFFIGRNGVAVVLEVKSRVPDQDL